jgi:hypothetical protein
MVFIVIDLECMIMSSVPVLRLIVLRVLVNADSALRMHAC